MPTNVERVEGSNYERKRDNFWRVSTIIQGSCSLRATMYQKFFVTFSKMEILLSQT